MRMIPACVTALALAASTAGATTVLLFTLDELAARSPRVVLADVGPSRPEIRSGILHTRTTLHVLETWKGAPARSVDVVQLGGSLDGVHVPVAGNALLVPGMRVLAFLRPQPDGAHVFAGMAQGCLRAEKDGTFTWSTEAPAFRDGAVLPAASRTVSSAELERTLGVRP